jgi:hypothetical protein
MSKQKKLAFDALSRYGYRGGPSVLKVPPPKEPDWSWSTEKDQKVKNKNDDKDSSTESYEEQERTRAALAQREKLLHVKNKKREKRRNFFARRE